MATTPGTPGPVAAVVHHVGTTGATAQAEQVGNLPPSIPSDKGILYTEVRKADGTISRVAVEVNKTGCGCNEKQMGISRELMDRVESAVKRTNVYVRAGMVPAPIIGSRDPAPAPGEGLPHARNVRINFTSLRLVYEVNGEEESMAIKEVKDVALKTFLLDIAKDVAHNATSDPSISSNRPLNRSNPLEIQTPAWHSAHRISAENYIKKDHTSLDAALRRDLGNETADRALPKIRAAEGFVTKFREQLEAKLREKKATPPPEERGARLALKRQILKLKELIAKLDAQKLDMKAIFMGVPYAKNDLEGLNLDEQSQRATLSQDAMQTYLTTTREAIGNPGAAFITAYSHDQGDLLIHDPWKYEERVDDRGGEKRGPSIEEFVVFNILNLNNLDEDCLDDAMSSLALPNNEAGDAEVTLAVRDALIAARAEVRTSYTADHNRLANATGLEAQTQALYTSASNAASSSTVARSEAMAQSRP